MASEFDPDHGRPHSAPMSFAFDTLAAAEAMRAAGMEPGRARAVAAQLRAAAASAGDAIARPELDAALAELKLELLDRITALLWRLFGGIVAVAGLAVAAVRLLPAGVAAG